MSQNIKDDPNTPQRKTRARGRMAAATLGIAACAACCAPLLLPLLAGAGGAGVAGATASGIFGASWGEIACAAIMAALVGSVIVLALRNNTQRKREGAQCGCGSGVRASCADKTGCTASR